MDMVYMMPITCIRTDSDNKDFISLVQQLDKDLAVRDGDDHPFYAQYNKIDAIKYVIVAYRNNEPVGCGAIKEYSPGVMEVKRMYVPDTLRNNGIATIVLSELETWAKELGCSKLILETGKKQPEAIRLYERSGYTVIPNFGQYEGIENSVCFEKVV